MIAKIAGAALLLALAGCNAYVASSPYPPDPNEREAAQGCLLSTGSFMPFGLLPAAASYPSDRASLDDCMAAHGWVRKAGY